MSQYFHFPKNLFLILIFQITTLVAANAHVIERVTGVITDSETHQSINHAEVFISGTTSGSIMDSLGFFDLKVPDFPCTFVADHIARMARSLNRL